MTKEQKKQLVLDYYGSITKNLAKVTANAQKTIWERVWNKISTIDKDFQLIVTYT